MSGRSRSSSSDFGLRTSFELLRSAQAGDEQARNDFCRRYLPLLERYAHGRLPRNARDLLNTQDLVQDTLMAAVKRLHGIRYRHEGAVQAYLFRALRNRIIDEIRKARRRPISKTIEERSDHQASPLEQVIGREALARFETAFDSLKPLEQQAITARIELGLSYQEIAGALDKPSPDAARMTVSRALVKLVRRMSNERR